MLSPPSPLPRPGPAPYSLPLTFSVLPYLHREGWKLVLPKPLHIR